MAMTIKKAAGFSLCMAAYAYAGIIGSAAGFAHPFMSDTCPRACTEAREMFAHPLFGYSLLVAIFCVLAGLALLIWAERRKPDRTTNILGQWEALNRTLLEPAPPVFNVSTRRVGGLRFVKLGRFCFSFCVTRQFRPIGE